MKDSLLKFRIFLADRLLTVILVLILVAAMGGWLTYTTHVEPGEETRADTKTWATNAGFDHHAIVEVDTEPFGEGEQVANRTTYFDVVMPELNGSFVYSHTGDGTLDVDIDLEYLVRAVRERDDNEEIIWEVQTDLGNQSKTIDSGDEATVDFQIDVNETIQQIQRIEEQLDESPGTAEAIVRAEVTGNGDMYSKPVEISEHQELAIVPGDSTYTVTGEESETEHSVTSVETVEATHSPIREGSSLLLLVGPLIGIGLLGSLHYWDKVDPGSEKRRALAHREVRSEFDDWISDGQLRPELVNGRRIDVDSLEDLVDVAIDSGRRVIDDTTRSGYFVVADDIVYVYDPEQNWEPGTLVRYAYRPSTNDGATNDSKIEHENQQNPRDQQ